MTSCRRNDAIVDVGVSGEVGLLGVSDIEGLVAADLLVAAPFENDDAGLTVGTHGPLVLEGMDEAAFQAIIGNEQVLV